MPILYCVIGAPLSDGAGHMRILPSSVTLGASGTPSGNTVVWKDTSNNMAPTFGKNIKPLSKALKNNNFSTKNADT